MKTPIDVTAAVIKKDEKILIARRAPGKHLAGYWEFPGGKIEEGETAKECLSRELKEEFDIDVKVHQMIAENTHDYGDKVIHLMAYSVEYISGTFKLSDHDRIEWVSPNDLPDWKLAPADIPIIDSLLI